MACGIALRCLTQQTHIMPMAASGIKQLILTSKSKLTMETLQRHCKHKLYKCLCVCVCVCVCVLLSQKKNGSIKQKQGASSTKPSFNEVICFNAYAAAVQRYEIQIITKANCDQLTAGCSTIVQIILSNFQFGKVKNKFQSLFSHFSLCKKKVKNTWMMKTKMQKKKNIKSYPFSQEVTIANDYTSRQTKINFRIFSLRGPCVYLKNITFITSSTAFSELQTKTKLFVCVILFFILYFLFVCNTKCTVKSKSPKLNNTDIKKIKMKDLIITIK